MDNPEMQTTLRTRHRRKTKKTTHITEKDKQHTPIYYYLRLVFLVYFWYCEGLLIIPDLKYLYCDMNYLFNPSNKSYFSKEPIFRLFNPPPSSANVLFKIFV